MSLRASFIISPGAAAAAAKGSISFPSRVFFISEKKEEKEKDILDPSVNIDKIHSKAIQDRLYVHWATIVAACRSAAAAFFDRREENNRKLLQRCPRVAHHHRIEEIYSSSSSSPPPWSVETRVATFFSSFLFFHDALMPYHLVLVVISSRLVSCHTRAYASDDRITIGASSLYRLPSPQRLRTYLLAYYVLPPIPKTAHIHTTIMI